MRTRTSIRMARLASLPLAASLLVACGGGGGDNGGSGGSGGGDEGGDASSAYCKDLGAAKESFESFESANPDPDQITAAFENFKSLADEAPPAVEADWKVIDGGITQAEDALGSIGLKISDLAEFRTGGDLPKGVTPQQLQEALGKLQTLGSEEFSKAGDNIEEHAKSECDIDLSPSSPDASPSS